MQGNILLTGGSGLLGTEIQKYFECDAPSSKEVNITLKQFPIVPIDYYDLLIHCAAYTDVVKAEIEKERCFNVNIKGTINMIEAYPYTPFVYISSEYAHNPINFYSKTKLAGELAVQALCKNYLIIRTLFKPVPFPFDKAFVDQYTQGDEITVIAPMIVNAIKSWDKKQSNIIYIGTGRKRIIDIARKSKPNVKKCSIKDVKGVLLPSDYK